MEIRDHFLPLAKELSILCEEDSGPFPILFTRARFTAALCQCRYHFLPLLLQPSLFAHGAVVKMSYLAVGSSVSRGAFGVILLWQWMDKCRRMTVKLRYFNRLIFIPWTDRAQTHCLFCCRCRLFQPQLQCSWPHLHCTLNSHCLLLSIWTAKQNMYKYSIVLQSTIVFQLIKCSFDIWQITVLELDILNKALTRPRAGI